jgi:hypothetical protein
VGVNKEEGCGNENGLWSKELSGWCGLAIQFFTILGNCLLGLKRTSTPLFWNHCITLIQVSVLNTIIILMQCNYYLSWTLPVCSQLAEAGARCWFWYAPHQIMLSSSPAPTSRRWGIGLREITFFYYFDLWGFLHAILPNSLLSLLPLVLVEGFSSRGYSVLSQNQNNKRTGKNPACWGQKGTGNMYLHVIFKKQPNKSKIAERSAVQINSFLILRPQEMGCKMFCIKHLSKLDTQRSKWNRLPKIANHKVRHKNTTNIGPILSIQVTNPLSLGNTLMLMG